MRSKDPSLSAAERINAACDRFESEWKAGRLPRVDDYLADVPASDRDQLRSELSAVERELLAGPSGLPPTVDHVAGPIETPVAIGRFEVREVLGRGGFGLVYRAHDPRLGRDVAVKVPVRGSLPTPEERERFLREARAAATLRHANICPVYEVGETDGDPYIVMAYVPGETLAGLIGKGKARVLSEKQAAIIVYKLAGALQVAHEHGVVHRDLKPANVLWDRERKDILLTDFGLARAPRPADAAATQSGVLMGSPPYMSPEQARGDAKGAGPASDVFSLGVIFYELLTGRRPFRAPYPGVLFEIANNAPEAPSRLRPGLDPGLEAVCLRALQKDPAARFDSMKEFARALQPYLRGQAGVVPLPAGAAEGGAAAPGADSSLEKVSGGSEFRRIAEVFASLEAERRAETAKVVEAVAKKARTPSWILACYAALTLLAVGGLGALTKAALDRAAAAPRVHQITLRELALPRELGDLTAPDVVITLDGVPQTLNSPVPPGPHALVVTRGGEEIYRAKISDADQGKAKRELVVQQLPPAKDAGPLSVWLDSRRVPEGEKEPSLALRAGTHQVAVRRGDRVVVTGEFRVEGGGPGGGGSGARTPAPNGPSARPPDAAEREDAEFARWLLSMGARCEIAVDGLPGTRWLGPGGSVPDRPLKVVNINLADNPQIDGSQFGPIVAWINRRKIDRLTCINVRLRDDGLAKLAACPSLTGLHLDGCGVTDKGIASIAGKPLDSLYLDALPITDQALATVAALPRLRSLGLDDLKTTDRGMAHLARCGSLRILTLWGMGRVTNDGIKALDGAAIQELSIRFSGPNEDVFPWLAGLPRLRALTVSMLTDKAAPELAKLKALKGLDLWGSGALTDAAVAPLSALKGLTSLQLSGTNLSDGARERIALALPRCNVVPRNYEHNRALAEWALKVGASVRIVPAESPAVELAPHSIMPGEVFKADGLVFSGRVGETFKDEELDRLRMASFVRTVELRAKGVSDRTLGALAKCESIETLVLSGEDCQVSAAALKALAALRKLRALDLSAVRVTDAELQALAGIRSLQELTYLNGPGVTEEGLAALAGLPSLRVLDGPGLAPGPKALAALKAAPLRRVTLARVGDSELRSLVDAMPQLTHLRLVEPRVTDAGLAPLAACKRLVELDLPNAVIHGHGLEALAHLPNLRAVRLPGSKITDDGVKALARLTLPRALDLSGTSVGDGAIATLRTLDALEDLDLSQTGVTAKALPRLAELKRLRRLRVNGDVVTDEALATLKKLVALRLLDLGDTSVSAEGLRALRAAFPICKVLPAPKDAPTFAPLDLSGVANERFDGSLFQWPGLTPGPRDVDGVRFVLGDGPIQLGGRGHTQYPEQATIRIKGRADRLHFIHGYHHGDEKAVMGAYVLHYEGGLREEILLAQGDNIRPYHYMPNGSTPRTSVALSHEYTGGNRSDLRQGLHRFTWENPHPDRLIVAIDFSARKEKTDTAPFLAALTVER